MPQEWVRRDVHLVVGQVQTAMHGVDTLRKMTNNPESVRALSIALTHLETANLYLTDLAGKTAEQQ